MKSIPFISCIALLVLFASCSSTKGLKPNDKLLMGSQFEFVNSDKISDRSELEAAIKLNFIKPTTPGLFNLKTGFYNIYDSTGTVGYKHMVKYKMGSAPVIFNPSMLLKTELRLQKLIKDSGYLQSEVHCDSITKQRKVTINCVIDTKDRFIIDSLFYLDDTLSISKILDPMFSLDFLKSGDFIQRKNIVSDRDQFVNTAKDNGFPLLDQEDLIFIIDTSLVGSKVNIHMQLRPPEDTLKYARYSIGTIYINPNFSLTTSNPLDTADLIQKENFKIYPGYDFLRESSLNKAMFIKKGLIFNQSRRTITSNRLIDLGLFKFVNVRTKINEDRSIDHFYNLTPYKMESISGELELNNRPGNFLGMVGKLTYSNRNMFKGAEKFELSLSGGLETQFGDKQSLINTSDISLESSLTIPSIILPFKPFKTNRNFIPKTFMSIGINQQRRVEFYTVRSARAQYGFKWNETINKSSFLKPIEFQWLTLQNTTAKFDSIILNDKRLEISLRNTLILGSSYEFIYNKRSKYNPLNQLYFKGTVESAGFLLSLVKKSNSTNPVEFLGTPYAQYLRFTTDVRKYWALGVGSLASRLNVGTGFAYGNSNEVPYSKQYSIGGSNSLRAFRLRRIGPGVYQPPATQTNNQFIDQTGDIKIEANLEYRFPIIGFFEGAAFIDAGNIWLYESTTRPDGVFNFNEFYKQIAVGTGFGLRIDFQYLLLRLDIAFPIRDLNDTGGFSWVIKDIDILNKSWRQDNLVYNLGIGYPF